jgi:ribosomal protein S27AE
MKTQNEFEDEKCPRCGSMKTQKQGTAAYIIMGICLFGVAVIFIWLPIISLIIAICGVLFLISAPAHSNEWKCLSCGHTWKIKK